MGHIDYSDRVHDRKRSPDDWLPRSPEVAAIAMPIAQRSDLVATIGPGVTDGVAPACYIPHRAEIRIDTDQCLEPGVKPASVDLSDRLWQLDHAELVGAIMHEAGHAAHTRWVARHLDQRGASPRQIDVTIALEEARIEGRIVKRRKNTRHFLRASAVGLILKDFETGQNVYGASIAAGLLLARADAGVLEDTDVAVVRDQVTAITGAELLDRLRPLWREFLGLSDHDISGALDVSKRWLELLGPEAESAPLAAESLTISERGRPSNADGSGDREWIDRSTGAIAVAADTAIAKQRSKERTRRARAAAAAGAERRETGKKIHNAVFVRGYDSNGTTISSRVPEDRREPFRSERAAATELADTLTRIQSVEGARVRNDRATPPGRLNPRALVRQIASATETPVDDLFRHYELVHGADDRLTVGFMMDISGSMGDAAEPMASAQWVVSHAATAVGGRVATVHYGIQAYGVQRSWTLQDTVDVYEVNDGWENFKDGFLALDAELELLDAPGARLLVIASDGRYGKAEQAEYARQAMTMCKDAGIVVLWLDFTGKQKTNYGYGMQVDVYRDHSPKFVVEKIAEAVIEMQQSAH